MNLDPTGRPGTPTAPFIIRALTVTMKVVIVWPLKILFRVLVTLLKQMWKMATTSQNKGGGGALWQ